MTFLKPLHLFEVYLYEATKKNAFSIMNSEPTSTIRKKIYADRYEISSGGLTFYQSAKNASDELVEVPVISFPAGKWESVSLIRNRIIIAEHKTGASTGASHMSIQSELKKNKVATTSNSFKIIQMPPTGKDTDKELGEINKLMEQVNKLVENQKEILSKTYEAPSKLVGKIFKEEKVEIEVSKPIEVQKTTPIKEVVKQPLVEAPPTPKAPEKEIEAENSTLSFDDLESLSSDEPPSIFPPSPVERKTYSKETIQRHIETEKEQVEETSLWEDLSAFDESVAAPEENQEPVIHEVNDNSFDDFNIDIDAITSALDDNKDFLGEEVKNPEPKENISLKVNKPAETVSTPKVEATVERKPAPQPKKDSQPELNIEDSDDIMGLLETLSDDGSELDAKEIKEKKKNFIINNLKSYLKIVEIFKFDQFNIYLEGEEEYQKYNVKEHEIYWEISQLILQQGISPRKFIKEKLQKHIALILPSIMKKHWDGSIITILDLAKEHNEIKDITLIDLSVWLAQNGYK